MLLEQAMEELVPAAAPTEQASRVACSRSAITSSGTRPSRANPLAEGLGGNVAGLTVGIAQVQGAVAAS